MKWRSKPPLIYIMFIVLQIRHTYIRYQIEMLEQLKIFMPLQIIWCHTTNKFYRNNKKFVSWTIDITCQISNSGHCVLTLLSIQPFMTIPKGKLSKLQTNILHATKSKCIWLAHSATWIFWTMRWRNNSCLLHCLISNYKQHCQNKIYTWTIDAKKRLLDVSLN